MTIWFDKNLTIDKLKPPSHNTMAEHLGIEWVALGSDYLKVRMPVDHRTKQPYGMLHGGASCALAETAGSIASWLVIDNENYNCVGLEINANHLRSINHGHVTAIAKPLHLGKSTHVWDIRIEDDDEKLVCISRLTVAIMKKRDQ